MCSFKIKCLLWPILKEVALEAGEQAMEAFLLLGGNGGCGEIGGKWSSPTPPGAETADICCREGLFQGVQQLQKTELL